MAAKETLQILIMAKDQASGALKSVGDSADNMRSGFLGLGPAATIGMAGIGTAAIGAGVALFNLGQDFQAAENIIKVGTGATGEVLAGLKDDFKAVFASVPTDTETAATAIADLNTMLGLTGQPLQDISTQMLNLSRITGTDLQTNINAVSRAIGDWGIDPVEDAANFMDQLFVASQASGMSVDALAQKVTQFGAPLRNLGFSIEESVALFAKWNKEGVNTDTIFGGLRIAVGKWASEGKDARTEFAKTVEAIKNAETPAEATAIAIEAFGQRAGPDLADAIRGGKFELDEYLDQIEGADGNINDTAKSTATLGERTTVLMNKFKTALAPVAAFFVEGLENGVTIVESVIEIFGLLGKKWDETETKLEGIAESVGVNFTDMAEAGSTKFTDLTKSQQTALNKMLLDQGVDGALLADNWGLTLGEISENTGVELGAMTEAAGLEFQTMNTSVNSEMSLLGDGVNTKFNTMRLGLSVGLLLLRGEFGLAWQLLKQVALNTWEELKNSILEKWQQIKQNASDELAAIKADILAKWNSIKADAAWAWFLLKTEISQKWQQIKDDVSEKLASIKQDISDKWSEMLFVVVAKVLSIKNYITNKWNEIQEFFTGIDLTQVGRDIINGLKNGIIEAANSLLESAEGIANDIVNAFKDPLGIFSPSKVFMEMGHNIGDGLQLGIEDSIPSVNNAVAGLVTPPSIGGGSGGGGGGRSITVNIDNLFGTDRRAARDLVRMLAQELELQGAGI